MNEKTLAQHTAYRRTWRMLQTWRCPEGIDIVLTEWPRDARIDVTLSSMGHDVFAPNVSFVTEADRDAQLGYLARHLMAQVVAAYDRHEVSYLTGDVILDTTLSRAERRFMEGLESAMYKRKGRDE